MAVPFYHVIPSTIYIHLHVGTSRRCIRPLHLSQCQVRCEGGVLSKQQVSVVYGVWDSSVPSTENLLEREGGSQFAVTARRGDFAFADAMYLLPWARLPILCRLALKAHRALSCFVLYGRARTYIQVCLIRNHNGRPMSPPVAELPTKPINAAP